MGKPLLGRLGGVPGPCTLNVGEPRRSGPTGWLGRGLGRGGGAAGWWPRRQGTADALRELPHARSLRRPGRPRGLSARQGSCLALGVRPVGGSVGTEGAGGAAGLGGGWRRRAPPGNQGAWPCLKGAAARAQKMKTHRSCPSGSVVCGETCTIASSRPECHLVGPGGLGKVD